MSFPMEIFIEDQAFVDRRVEVQKGSAQMFWSYI
tara:strand:+ start:621 stop:722 length:102 start_codon:yes stop_codon:yes gene_type:complete